MKGKVKPVVEFARKHTIAIAVAIMILSSLLLAYPFVSDWLYTRNTSQIVLDQNNQEEQLDENVKAKIWDEANQYNKLLVTSKIKLKDPFIDTAGRDEIEERYYSTLNVDDNGLMCFVEIPSINVYLPVYHGTSEDTLEQGAGHMMGTSMPVGGEDTHTVISAHTGMSKMRMFTDLIDVKKGEFFFLHTLGQTLAYKVDRIDIVEPAEMNLLNVEKGEDLCTLITCTPYGVNSHRLLVRGKRTPYDPEAAQRAREMAMKSVRGQSQWLREYVKAASSGFGLIAGIATFGFLYSRMQRQNENKRKETSSWY